MRTRHLVTICAALGALAGAACFHGAAAEAKKPDVNPAGTWKWTFTTQSGQSFEPTLKLKLEGDKLTGTITGRDGTETTLKEPKFKGEDLGFVVVRERDGQKITSKYQGKISGDTIKGKIESDFGGQTRTRDWEAKRQTLADTWNWSFEIPNGPTLEPSLKLKQEGDQLSGVLVIGERERAISEGKIKNSEVSFKVVSKRDDRTVTSTYQGKWSGDTIKGKWTSDWTGEAVTRDWEAKRAKSE